MQLRTVAIALLLIASTDGSASAAGRDFVRSGFKLFAGAVIGFEASEDLDQTNQETLTIADDWVDELIRNGELGAGTTGTSELEVSVMPGFAFAASYRFNRFIAAEADVEWARGDVDRVDHFVGAGGDESTVVTQVAQYSYWLLGANAKAYSNTGRIQFYGLVGVSLMSQGLEIPEQADYRGWGAGFRFGGGVETYITRQLVFETGVSYVLAVGQITGNDVISWKLGLGWNF